MTAPTTPAPIRVATDPDGDREAVRRSLRGGGLNLAGSLVNAASAFVVVALLTNSLGATRAGVLLAVTNIALLLASLLKLGAEHGSVYALAGGTAAAERWGVVAAAVVPPGALSLIAATGMAVAAAPLADLLLGDRSHAGLLIVASVAVPPFIVGQVLLGATRGLGTMAPTVRWGQIVRPLAQLVAVGAGLVLGAGDATLVALWSVPVWVLPLGASAELVRRLGRPTTASWRAAPWRRFWVFTGPRAVADTAAGALERLDIVLISAMSGPLPTALYAAANRLTNVAVVGMHAVAQAAAPELRAAHARGDRVALAQVAKAVTNLTVTLLWPLAVHLSLSGADVLSVFGPEFGDAAGALAVLSLGLAVAVTLGPGDVLVMMTGRSVRSLVNHLVAVATDVVLIVLLVPDHGALGAAVAWSTAIVLMRVLAVVQIARAEGILGTGPAAIRLSGVAIGAHVAGVLLVDRLLSDGLPGAVLAGCVGLALHAAVLSAVPSLRRALTVRAV